MNRFFRLVVGDNEDAWHLQIAELFTDGSPLDIWAYGRCMRLERPKPVPFTIQVDGQRIDHYHSAFGAIVVSKRLAVQWESIAGADIQRIPAFVEGDSGEWEVINIVSCVDCIDHKRSKITYYTDKHPERPGKPRGVLRLVLDRERIGNHHIFHPKDWEVVTIVSDAVKRAMEVMQATGVDYWPVTD